MRRAMVGGDDQPADGVPRVGDAGHVAPGVRGVGGVHPLRIAVRPPVVGALPQDQQRDAPGAMKPVQFPKQKAEDYPDASKLPRGPKPTDEADQQAQPDESTAKQPDESKSDQPEESTPDSSKPAPPQPPPTQPN